MTDQETSSDSLDRDFVEISGTEVEINHVEENPDVSDLAIRIGFSNLQ